MIHVTEPAAEQIRRAAILGGTEGLALRLAVRPLPDGSLDYGMGFDIPKEDDIRAEMHGITLVVAPHFQSILNDLTLDYVEITEGDFRFIFQNPNDASHAP